MRLSELLGAEVRDGNDRRVGFVQDVRLVQDGPELDGFGRAFRVEGVIVGRRGSQGLMRLERGDVKGPLLFAWLARRANRRATFVPWEQVRDVEEGRLSVRLEGGRRPATAGEGNG